MGLSKYTQKGGLQIDSGNAKEAFEHFIANSSIHLLSRGSFGLTFVAKLSPGATTNYKHIIWSRYDVPVDSILFKISCTFDESKGEDTEKLDLSQKGHEYHLRSVDVNEFKKEVNTQIDIFFKSITYLQPYCPGIVYANDYKNTQETYVLIDKITNNITNPIHSGVMRSIKQALMGDECSGVGFIGMEFLEGYDTIYNLVDPNNKDKQAQIISYNYHMIGLYIIMKVAVDTGYSHGDFHTGNLLINPNELGYFGKSTINGVQLGAPMMIDFGLTVKIPPQQHALIKEYYAKAQYSKIFKILCDLGRSDGFDLYSHDFYEWVCHNLDWKLHMVKAMEYLIQKREVGINNTIKVFEILHNNVSSTYPRLPISNQIKNKLFSGMIDPTPMVINDAKIQSDEDMMQIYYNNTEEDDLDIEAMLGVKHRTPLSIGGKKSKKRKHTNMKRRKSCKR
uniref:Protein kinase domain-containing protein n=1 Tax=viral metagenome TaxID=1070528 RepID=A0A6C0IUB7_9ZZZZ